MQQRFETLVRHPLAIAGAVIATASAVVFIVLTIAMVAGMFPNPYAGLVIFVILPLGLIAGLTLIPAGMWLQRRKLLRHPETPSGWPVFDFRIAAVRRRALAFVALTAVNVMLVLLGGYGSLHWMESPSFCGQACHTPMEPQFVAWQHGPHARVACVNCHIGEGPKGFLHAKLNGVRQLLHVTTGSYPRPVPPGAEMPEGAQAETCLGCHQPTRATGDRLRVLREYGSDEANTEATTNLQMHVGRPASAGRFIHWHADPANRVEYVATDGETIPYVKVTDAKGQVKEYRTADATDQAIQAGTRKTMDCMDCHNTVGHPISPVAEKAVDHAISSGSLSATLPFVRRESVRLVTAEYATQEEGLSAIERGMATLYSSQASVDPDAARRAVIAVQDVYRRNVFPSMKVTFGSYPDNRGHVVSPGCVRCHDEGHTAGDGSTISGDCELCHKQIEQ